MSRINILISKLASKTFLCIAVMSWLLSFVLHQFSNSQAESVLIHADYSGVRNAVHYMIEHDCSNVAKTASPECQKGMNVLTSKTMQDYMEQLSKNSTSTIATLSGSITGPVINIEGHKAVSGLMLDVNKELSANLNVDDKSSVDNDAFHEKLKSDVASAFNGFTAVSNPLTLPYFLILWMVCFIANFFRSNQEQKDRN